MAKTLRTTCALAVILYMLVTHLAVQVPRGFGFQFPSIFSRQNPSPDCANLKLCKEELEAITRCSKEAVIHLGFPFRINTYGTCGKDYSLFPVIVNIVAASILLFAILKFPISTRKHANS